MILETKNHICCFGKKTEVVVFDGEHVLRTTFDELDRMILYGKPNKFKIPSSDGKWVDCELLKSPQCTLHRIQLWNAMRLLISENHIHATSEGYKETKDLNAGDFLRMNTRVIEGIRNTGGATYDLGYIVGLYLSDFSFISDSDNRPCVSYHFRRFLASRDNRLIDCMRVVDPECSWEKLPIDEGGYYIRCYSKKISDYIKYWTNWTGKKRSVEKQLNPDCLVESSEFRCGIKDGYFDAEYALCNSSARLSSKQAAECLQTLCMSLGIVTKVSKKYTGKTYKKIHRGHIRTIKDTEYKVIMRERIFGTSKNITGNLEHLYPIVNGERYIKIRHLKRYELDCYHADLYGFATEDNSDIYFCLPFGMVTHNGGINNAEIL